MPMRSLFATSCALLRSRGGQFRFTSAMILPNWRRGGNLLRFLMVRSPLLPHITDSHISWTPKLSVGGSLISKIHVNEEGFNDFTLSCVQGF